MVPFCLILEPIPLVAKDLATTARENLGYEPIVAASEVEALQLMQGLDGGSSLSLAFVHDTASDFASSSLRRHLEKRGTKIILLGPEPGSDWPTGDWPALAWPFSTHQLLALITSLDGSARNPVSDERPADRRRGYSSGLSGSGAGSVSPTRASAISSTTCNQP